MAALIKSIVEKWVALYVRLSRDDENEGDSNSIAHQIEILTRYAKEHGITNYKIYKDDGYSGTNFKRPGFQEMLADIEAGLVSMVIVKDMSRFGRNYLEVGLYTEIRFPEMGVRFVAVNDGVDSDNQSDNDFTPFRNIMNEWYAKDTSKKLRAVLRNKGLSGKRIAVRAPYGYIRCADGSLIIDEEAKPIVQLIFQLCIEGNGARKISRILQERKIPSPATLEFQRTGHTKRYHPDTPYYWPTGTIACMLKQDTYIGQTTNFKTFKPSYKSKRMIKNPPEKWVTFENTHPAIIDRETWDMAQKELSQRHRPTRTGEMGLFSGLVFCADCGSRLHLRRSAGWTYEQECYTCSGTQSRIKCTAHYIRSVVLEQLVLQNLQRVMAYVKDDEDEFVRLVMRNKLNARMAEQEQAKRQLEKQERRILELDSIIQRLYEDHVIGKLTAERFVKMSAGYEQEQADLKNSVKELRELVSTMETEEVNIQSFLKIVKKYTEPTELTPLLLHEFVEKIVVHAPDRSSGQRVQQIDVHYNFIGEIDLSPEYIKTNT